MELAPDGAKFEITYPENVREQFHKAIEDRVFSDNNEDKQKQAFFDMAFAMQQALKNYDERIRGMNRMVNKSSEKSIWSSITELIKSGVLKW